MVALLCTEPIMVRNTFVHFDASKTQHRRVKTLPCDMFSHYVMLSESEKQVSEAASTRSGSEKSEQDFDSLNPSPEIAPTMRSPEEQPVEETDSWGTTICMTAAAPEDEVPFGACQTNTPAYSLIPDKYKLTVALERELVKVVPRTDKGMPTSLGSHDHRPDRLCCKPCHYMLKYGVCLKFMKCNKCHFPHTMEDFQESGQKVSRPCKNARKALDCLQGYFGIETDK